MSTFANFRPPNSSIPSSQVGGYAEEYNNGNFRFATVRNAGHMVPYMQPARALQIFKAFLNDTPFPTRQQPITVQLVGRAKEEVASMWISDSNNIVFTLRFIYLSYVARGYSWES